jgi:hypothetical protein
VDAVTAHTRRVCHPQPDPVVPGQGSAWSYPRSPTLALTGLPTTAYSSSELVTVGTWTASMGACPDRPDSTCAVLG